MVHSFGLNTNVLETNIVNLAVVLRVVINAVGDSLRTLLDQRQQKILSDLRSVTRSETEAQTKTLSMYSDSLRSLESAHKVRKSRTEVAKYESSLVEQRTKDEVERLAQKTPQLLYVEYRKVEAALINHICENSLSLVKQRLIKELTFEGEEGRKNHSARTHASRKILATLSPTTRLRC